MTTSPRVQAFTLADAVSGEFGFGNFRLVVIVSSVIRQFSLLGEETSMSKDAQDDVALTEDAKKKLEECVAALAACGFGEDGPPLETTFAEIEAFGHKVGRIVARSVDESLTSQHADYFQGESKCPSCGHRCDISDIRESRSVQTTDGDVPIQEPICHCPACNRDFFPSACRVED